MKRRWLLLLAACSGCALLQKAEPIRPTYLTPYEVGDALPERAAGDATLAVRLRRVRAAGHLGQRIVVRRDGHDVAFLEASRWTDPPSEIVEQRIGRALFEQSGLTRIVRGGGPTLEVELRGFELVAGDPPLARVALTALLHDEGRALFEQTLTFEQPVPEARLPEGDDPALGPAFAEAMGEALDRAIVALSARVVGALERHEPLAER